VKAFDYGSVNPAHAGDHRLYRLDPPLKGWDGGEHEWVVSSAATVLGEPEVYLFPATDGGDITGWSELNGSQRGALDHQAPFRGLGYSVVPK
jgi:hypothetical protein